MTAKIVEALAKILEGLRDNNSLEEVNNLLRDNNEFDKQTISAAFSLVYDKDLNVRLSKKKRTVKKNNKFRILTDDEKEILGIDNYNYIMRLNNVGLIDAIDFELFIEQLMLFPENSITRDDINWSILISLVNLNAEILPGSRVLLYSSDTIN
jgi:uncharacterized protein Smg (DUF494 family)